MTLKRKVAINISLAFSLLFGLAATFVYLRFTDFRKAEFEEKLENKAYNTAKLVDEIKRIDNVALQILDRKTLNKINNEKILVFDHNYQLIYTSIDDAKINWTKNDLLQLNKKRTFFRTIDDKELLGIRFDFSKNDRYYVLILGQDKYGISKMNFLMVSLIVSFVISILFIWTFTYFLIKKSLQPLDDFQEKITTISANQLNLKLPESNTNNEIDLLTRAFNNMLDRLEKSFSMQKEFTSNASHELYTPLTRIALQIENLMTKEEHSEGTKKYLKNINNDIHQVADLINALLLLARVEKTEINKNFKPIRIDDIILKANELTAKNYPELIVHFEIIDHTDMDNPLEIKGNQALLVIVFTNLIKNGFLYSEDKKVNITIHQKSVTELAVSIENNGSSIPIDDQSKIFDSFVRGKNATNTQGSGIGLRIVKKILEYHNAQITYKYSNQTNIFTINFSI
ncbi:sensor histidine kinase [Flavobacterium sp.]|jgi:two-component system sensor histidine kinase ArlS|uniref:sensor histidine kinase n=1 Tax=Flavobacterium sp. TaxID=239 RepID=UPI0037BEC795